MGVTNLWSILQPCARPIKLSTLNRKRLAVDASIWIYQFLKAVRDKEGNALRNSHVVGFFRRICKLLFFGIKPVFVFDGGAPALKRQTVLGRRRRREGRREDAVRTAGRLLAVQMLRRAEEDEGKRKEARAGRDDDMDEPLPDEAALVYVDELQMTPQERQQTRTFRKKDAYHLPDLATSLHDMGGPNDPRIMSLVELEAYARQFDAGDDDNGINVYDFSAIDYDSAFFTSLPPSDRYNILNAARLRSRLRMGHSKEQLDDMFPDRMAFSKFQIERVKERNELTQRLMNLDGFGGGVDGDAGGGGRVAGEKGREYVLVKNEGVEGGWALGVIGDEGTKRERPIDVDAPVRAEVGMDGSESDGEGFEDVPIEGLNRLPKRRRLNDGGTSNALASPRDAQSTSRRSAARRKPRRPTGIADSESLFLADEAVAEVQDDAGWEDADTNGELFGTADSPAGEDEEEDLRRAIAMSLEQAQQPSSRVEDSLPQPTSPRAEEDDETDNDDMREVFQQSAVEAAKPIPKGSARAIANLLNKRAFESAPESHEVTSFGVPVSRLDDDEPNNLSPVAGTFNNRGSSDVGEDADEDSMDLLTALAESRRSNKRKFAGPVPAPTRVACETVRGEDQTTDSVMKKKAAAFSGPLPFQKLDLGSSLLGKKKLQQRTEEAAGGFENPELEDKTTKRNQQQQEKKAEPLPPWFSGDIEKDVLRQRAIEAEDRQRAKEFNEKFQFQRLEEPKLRRGTTGEVIDLVAEEDGRTFGRGEVIDLEADGQEQTRGAQAGMDEAAEVVVRVEPSPMPAERDQSEGSGERTVTRSRAMEPVARLDEKEMNAEADELEDEEGPQIDWSESEDESPAVFAKLVQPTPGLMQQERSPSVEFEDVLPNDEMVSSTVGEPKSPSIDLRNASTTVRNGVEPNKTPTLPLANDLEDHVAIIDDDNNENDHNDYINIEGSSPAAGLSHQDGIPEDDFDDVSDPEEQELLRALLLETEEHARFASTLTNNPSSQQQDPMQTHADYERELRQLRNQQKKDRRDADEVTQTMVAECQQLLSLFGLPYVTAPMEAEAQCAELVRLGLVDGIVTDDSDCFLFGGTRVYKNMFNQAKFVECYLASDLEREFDLTRGKMVQIAQLLGSDYTEGLGGVGPVTALEILAEFATLEEFRAWFEGVQVGVVTKEDDKGSTFRKKFRKQAAKILLPPSFPDPRVDAAYWQPDVDSDPQAFQWGVPDLDALRSFLMATVGWSEERTDEILVPVIRDMNQRLDEGVQSNITAFFEGGVGVGARGEAFAPRKRVEGSKRMGNALGRMAERAKVRRAKAGESVEPDAEAEGAGAAEQDAAPSVDNAVMTRTMKDNGARKRPTAANLADEKEEDASEYEAPRKKPKKRTGQAKGRKVQVVATE